MRQLYRYTGLLKIIGLLVIFPLMVYILAINKTVYVYQAMKAQEKQLLLMQVDSIQTQKMDDRMVTSDDVKTGSVIKSITKYILKEDIFTESYTPTLIYKGNDIEVYAGELVLTGEFTGLTSVLSKMERQSGSYHIASVQYKTVSDLRKQSNRLVMTVILQQIIGE